MESSISRISTARSILPMENFGLFSQENQLFSTSSSAAAENAAAEITISRDTSAGARRKMKGDLWILLLMIIPAKSVSFLPNAIFSSFRDPPRAPTNRHCRPRDQLRRFRWWKFRQNDELFTICSLQSLRIISKLINESHCP